MTYSEQELEFTFAKKKTKQIIKYHEYVLKINIIRLHTATSMIVENGCS